MKLLTHIKTAAMTAITLLLALNVSASEIVEHEYTVSDVLEVQVSSGIRLELTQGATESLKLKAPARMLKQIHVDLTNHKLRLSAEKDFVDLFTWLDGEEIVFTLVTKNLQLIDVSGGVEANIGNLKLDALTIKNSGGSESNFSSLDVKELKIETSGGADVSVKKITSDNLNINVSGGSDFELENAGTTNSLMINASGGSDCDAKNLSSVTAEVIAGGAADVDVRASKTLKVSAGGTSDIRYYGNPQVTSNIGGASTLSAKN